MPPSLDLERAADVLDKLARLPEETRAFSVSPAAAWSEFRLRRDALDALVAAGLAVRRVDGEPRYDHRDLSNLGMHLGFSPAGWAARRIWGSALNRPAGDQPRYAIHYGAQCPTPGHADTCRYTLALPDAGAVEHRVPAGHPRTLHRAEVSPRGAWPDLPPAARDLLDEAHGLSFMFMPRSLRYDLDFQRRTGIGDCTGASRLLITRASRHGVTARWGFGLIAVPPFGTAHNWIEIHTDGVWVPADPLLLDAMIYWGALDPATWNHYRSPGALFVRVGDRDMPIGRHEGDPIPITLETTSIKNPSDPCEQTPAAPRTPSI